MTNGHFKPELLNSLKNDLSSETRREIPWSSIVFLEIHEHDLFITAPLPGTRFRQRLAEAVRGRDASLFEKPMSVYNVYMGINMYFDKRTEPLPGPSLDHKMIRGLNHKMISL